MRFYSPGCVLLFLLVALTCTAEGASLRAKRFVFLEDIGNTLSDIGETIKNTVTGFGQTEMNNVEMVQPTVQPNSNETVVFRQIISAPPRCPPSHVLVKDRCRFVMQKRR